jgi:hypothetical protein
MTCTSKALKTFTMTLSSPTGGSLGANPYGDSHDYR